MIEAAAQRADATAQERKKLEKQKLKEKCEHYLGLLEKYE